MFSTMANPVARESTVDDPVDDAGERPRGRTRTAAAGRAAFIVSSMNGATVTATTSSGKLPPLEQRGRGVVDQQRAAGRHAGPPQEADATISHSGDGWYRSSHRKQATSTGTGRMAPRDADPERDRSDPGAEIGDDADDGQRRRRARPRPGRRAASRRTRGPWVASGRGRPRRPGGAVCIAMSESLAVLVGVAGVERAGLPDQPARPVPRSGRWPAAGRPRRCGSGPPPPRRRSRARPGRPSWPRRPPRSAARRARSASTPSASSAPQRVHRFGQPGQRPRPARPVPVRRCAAATRSAA